LRESEKDLPLIQTLLASKSLWLFTHCEDPFVRRAIYTLLQSSLSIQTPMLDWKIISTTIIGKTLSASQIGSASELSDALLQLTRSRPQIWTSDYFGKVPASKQLRRYLQRGSQGARVSYWLNIIQLLQAIPLEAISEEEVVDAKLEFSEGSSLMEAFQDGLNSRDEPRQNLATGWRSYIDVGIWVSTVLAEDKKSKFIQERVLPILEQYIRGSKEHLRWNLPPQPAATMCTTCFIRLVERGYEDALLSLWTKINHDLLQAVKNSSPEVSADFKSLQDSLCGQANRLFTFEAGVLSRISEPILELMISKIFEDTSIPLIENSLQVLCTLYGKPYGAAAIVEEAVHHAPFIVIRSKNLIASLQDNIPKLLFSPSAEQLMTILLACRSWDGFDIIFRKVAKQIVEAEPDGPNMPVLQKFLSTIDFISIPERPELESMVLQLLKRVLKGDRVVWPIVIAAVGNKTIHSEFLDHVLVLMLDALSSERTVFDALFGLSQVISRAPAAIQKFLDGINGPKLLSKLLYLAESPDSEIAQYAESLRKTVNDAGFSSMGSNLKILKNSFSEVSRASPS
jgi:E3 ubiquitin-protein ligase listerin